MRSIIRLMFARARSINDVISLLSQIIEDCHRHNSRLGYFAAMYRKVTMRIDEGVQAGRFEDGARMEHLDVVFANRYIEDYDRYRQGLPTTRSWGYAFAMAQRSQPIILQHLLLGMNAHINLDLGIAAAEVCRGRDIETLKNDFFEVNDVLANLLEEVQEGVNESSPLFRILDRLGWQSDEALGNFSIRRARQSAWHRALELHSLPEDQFALRIAQYDHEVAELAQVICPASGLRNALFQAISESETQEPRQIIEELV